MSTSASTYSDKNYKMNLAPQYPPFTPDRAQKYISVLYYHRCLKYFLPQKKIGTDKQSLSLKIA